MNHVCHCARQERSSGAAPVSVVVLVLLAFVPISLRDQRVTDEDETQAVDCSGLPTGDYMRCGHENDFEPKALVRAAKPPITERCPRSRVHHLLRFDGHARVSSKRNMGPLRRLQVDLRLNVAKASALISGRVIRFSPNEESSVPGTREGFCQRGLPPASECARCGLEVHDRLYEREWHVRATQDASRCDGGWPRPGGHN